MQVKINPILYQKWIQHDVAIISFSYDLSNASSLKK